MELLSRCRSGAFDVDAPAGVLNHNDLETFAACIFGRIADAEVKGEAGQKHPRQATFAQVTGESRPGPAIVFIEGRVGVDMAVVALAQDQFGMGDVQAGVKSGT